SPTTVSAVKVNWRPPLTVLLTRLTATSFSIMPSSISSRSRLRSRPRDSRCSAIAMSRFGREFAALPLMVVVWSGGPLPSDISRGASGAARTGRVSQGAPGAALPRRPGEPRPEWPGRTVLKRQCSAMDGVHDRIFKRQGQAPADPSELQATFAGGIGQRLDAAVVAVARAVERDLLDAGLARLLGDRAANLGGGVGVLAALEAFAQAGLGGAGRSQDLRAVGAEYLGVDVLAGAQHRQARHAEFADVRARGLGAAQAGDFLFHGYALWREADRLAVVRRTRR